MKTFAHVVLDLETLGQSLQRRHTEAWTAQARIGQRRPGTAQAEPGPMRSAQLLALLCLPRDAHSLHHPAFGESRDLSSSPASPAGDSSSEPPAGDSSSEPALSEAAANLVFSGYLCDSAAADKGGCETLSRHFKLSSLLPPSNSKTLLFGSSFLNEVAQAIIAAGRSRSS